MAKKILIVEDEVHVADYLKNIFQDHGYEAVTAPNAEQGLQMARAEKPDMITLDLQMPADHGTKFYQWLRKEEDLAGIPILVVTGQDAPHRSIKQSKVVAIVQKPFEPDDVIARTREAIGQP